MTQGTIAHYRVLHEIGRGGMGVVCKAEDLRLGRMVALKFLPPHLTSEPQRRERLLREARAASSLDHPNICTIHQVEDTGDGQLVVVMSYYEGETLSQRIERGRLELPAAVTIMRKLLSGLAHAHERGVIHRDIKPSNVMLTSSGEVKLVDFGLAKVTGSKEALTETNAVIGTMAYIPPEVLAGHEIDHRGDLWSSAIVFYEMLTGTTPFAGANSFVVLHSILHDEVAPICQLRPELPWWIGSMMQRALAKRRDERFQSAHEFLAGLDPATEAPEHPGLQITMPIALPPREVSIVVVPFAVLGGETQAALFGDGLTEELITDLSTIHGVRVICRNSASRLSGTHDSAKQIAEELNVRYVMEGAVRTAAGQLRVTAKLIDPATDSLLWAEKFSGSLEDVFAIQENISRRIVEALRLKLSPEESQRLADKPIHDLRAWEYYLRAKQEILAYSAEALERALGYLKQGEQIIGENPLLLSAMGQAYWQFVNAGISTDPKYLEHAERCARRILELDPASGHGYRLLGLVDMSAGRTQQAVNQLKKSLEINSNDADTLSWLCVLCSMSGKGYAVSAMAQRLVAIDPLTPIWNIVPGLVAQHSGEFGRALEPFGRALAGDPKNTMLQFVHAQTLAMDGRTNDALAELDAMQGTQMDFFARLGAFYAAALRHDAAAAHEAATADVVQAALADMSYAWSLAQGYALIGEPARAMAALQAAVDKGFINYPLLHHLDPFLASLRAEPAFIALMDATRRQWEAFEA